MDLGELLESSGAILHGHFVLSSGRHSDVYVEKFRILERPEVLTALCAEIAARFQEDGVDVVAGPTTGGVIIAFEVARQMGLPALYVETEDGRKTVRRGATVPPGARVLVVDDVLTTGLSVKETVCAVEERGGVLAGVAVLVQRTEAPPEFGAPFLAVHRVSAVSYAPEEVPDWLAKLPIHKPGTRKS